MEDCFRLPVVLYSWEERVDNGSRVAEAFLGVDAGSVSHELRVEAAGLTVRTIHRRGVLVCRARA